MVSKVLVVLTSLVLLAGCASGLSSRQETDLAIYESRGLAVQEKSPAVATALGILPGGGSFYGRQYALGVVNLLFWPLSICWDPVSGYNAATKINYVETKENVRRLKEKAINELNQKRTAGLVDDYAYTMGLYAISQKYDIDPIPLPLQCTSKTSQPQTPKPQVDEDEADKKQK